MPEAAIGPPTSLCGKAVASTEYRRFEAAGGVGHLGMTWGRELLHTSAWPGLLSFGVWGFDLPTPGPRQRSGFGECAMMCAV